MTAIANAQATTNTLGIPVPAPTTSGRAALPDTVSNQSHPAPTPTPKPGHLAVSGKVRGYDFVRLNSQQVGSQINKHAVDFGALPHLDYRVGDSPFNIGYTYGGATGFGFNNFDGKNTFLSPASKVDDTLPGYPLNQAVHELYIQYKDAHTMVTVGDQELNYPWMPTSDSRVLPASYRGIDSQVTLSSTLSAGITRVFEFESRNSPAFGPNNLLTGSYPGAAILNYEQFTPGTLRVSGNYHPAADLVLSAENDEFYNVADLTYLEAKVGLDPYSRVNPYIASQFVSEGPDGSADEGIVKNRTIGVQLGGQPVKNVTLALSGDFAPVQYADVSATSASAAEAGYFVGSGGTPDARKIGTDLYQVAYGGIASPYTDSLGTDPLYTTAITQGMVDRRTAASSYKACVIFTNETKQLRLLVSESSFDYSNAIGRNLASEFNADGTYYFNKVRPGGYKGFFVRIRLAPRQSEASAARPQLFEYQRFQTEYDF